MYLCGTVVYYVCRWCCQCVPLALLLFSYVFIPYPAVWGELVVGVRSIYLTLCLIDLILSHLQCVLLFWSLSMWEGLEVATKACYFHCIVSTGENITIRCRVTQHFVNLFFFFVVTVFKFRSGQAAWSKQYYCPNDWWFVSSLTNVLCKCTELKSLYCNCLLRQKRYYVPAPRVGGIKRWCTSDACLSPVRAPGCKNGPSPFPGQMSYKATKPGMAVCHILACFFIVLLFIRAPFYLVDFQKST